jgi:hypothetical protein
MVSWFSSSWQHGLIGMGFGRVCASGRGKREGKNSEKNVSKTSSPLSLHSQRRRPCTVPFKTTSCPSFVFEQ